MAFLNGRLPGAALAPITRAVNGQQAYLARSAAKAFMAMNAESEHRFHVTLRVAEPATAYRTLAQQWYFWNLYRSGRGNLAAYPGTSNHGWGLAVDLATPQMRSIVDQIGAKYGWAKRWSDAPSEWWHIKYRAGIWNGHSSYATHPVLKRGSKGRAVLRLKKLMRHHGLRGFVAGPWFGKGTQDAIKRLQKRHGLKPDGIVGPKTWGLLR